MSSPKDPKRWEHLGDALAEVISGAKPAPPEVPARCGGCGKPFSDCTGHGKQPEVPAPDEVWCVVDSLGEIRAYNVPLEEHAAYRAARLQVVRYVRAREGGR